MAAFEDSYKAQLQGVSQQLPKDRLDGQLSAQQNMLSDPVTNLRRRPGAEFAMRTPIFGATTDSLAVWNTSIGDLECIVMVNCLTGQCMVQSYVEETGMYNLLGQSTSPYMVAAAPASLVLVSLGESAFLVNKEQLVLKGAVGTAKPPKQRGFLEVLAGAFNKKYDITLTSASGITGTVTYTTPAGTAAGDANASTAGFIANSLATSIMALPSIGATATPAGGVTAFAIEGTVYLEDTVAGSSALTVNTSAGRTFITTSGASYLRDAAALPAVLSPFADGYTVMTGSTAVPVYYTYNSASTSWLESGEAETGFSTLENVPLSIRRGGVSEDDVVFEYLPFEGRLAGDAISNPDPSFLRTRITGAGAYQGRLVLLCGSKVYMSASGNPRRFYRSTVTSLIDSDTIGIGATAASSAEWAQAVEYGKDLLLFSTKYQGVVPGSNTAITPRSAAVLVTGKYSGDVLSVPVNVGRSVMFAKPVSDQYFGVMEMVASQYADSTYTSYDSTGHLPRYMAGRCRLAVASSAVNMVAFLGTVEKDVLIIHEYTWQGDTKVQQAWHKWKFPLPIASAFFIGSRLHLVFVRDNGPLTVYVDPRASTSIADSTYKAPLDFCFTTMVVGGRAFAPQWVANLIPGLIPDMVGCVSAGPLASEPVPLEYALLFFVGAPEGTQITVGVPFTSSVEFTPPMLKDHNGVKITTNKATVTRFIVGTNASREFQISISDEHTSEQQDIGEDPYTASPLTFSSTELVLGEARVGGPDSSVVIPARTAANSTRLILSSSGTGELNITSLEYVMKTKEQIQRKKG